MLENERLKAEACVMSHEEMLRTHGFDLCSPISGSMMPMVRPRRDTLLFERPKGRLRRYDVALYKRDGLTIMHRVIRVKKDGYILRGDHAKEKEFVREEQIIGVMTGFYRGERFVPADDGRYLRYARWIVRAHPVLPMLRWVRRRMKK